MLLFSDLKDLEEKGPDADGHWSRVARLSRALRHAWVRTMRPLPLDDTPVELAAGRIGTSRFIVAATVGGGVSLIRVGRDTLHAEPVQAMAGFDPARDEVRNIVLSPRRYSTDVDVFITVRRWSPQDSRPWTRHVWRAAIWLNRDEPDGPAGTCVLRPLVEGRALDRLGWVESPEPEAPEDRLPDWLFQAQAQFSLPDPLGVRPQWPDDGGDTVSELIAIAATRQAWLNDEGQVCWRLDELHETTLDPLGQPTALALDTGGRQLIIASSNGRLLRHTCDDLQAVTDEPPAPETHELDAAVSVLSILPPEHKEDQADAETDIIVAGRDRRLHRWRYIGPQRLRQAWDGIVHERSAALNALDWRRWAGHRPEGDGPEAEIRQLLWLHAAWTDASLLDGYCELARSRGRFRPGMRAGQALADLIVQANGDRHAIERASRIYEAAGLALREQVDRARPVLADSSLSARLTHNYWHSVAEHPPVSPEHRNAVGHLATQPYLHEASWRGTAALIGVIASGRNPWLVAADRQGLHGMRLPAGGATGAIDAETREAVWPFATVTSADGVSEGQALEPGRWTWVRSLHRGGERFGIVFGNRHEARLVWPTGSQLRQTQLLQLTPGQHMLGAVLLDAPSQERLALAFAWAEGPRVRLDGFEITLNDGNAKRVAVPREHVPVPASVVDGTEIDGVRWLAAGAHSRRLEWLRQTASDDMGTGGSWTRVEQAGQALDSAVLSLRFALGLVGGTPAPVLIACTQGGRVWCLDARTRQTLWVHQAGGTTTALDLCGEGRALRIAVCATPHGLTLLDAEGRRVWRHRIGMRPVDVSLIPSAASTLPGTHPDAGPDRIIVIDDAGGLSVYRRSNRADWRAHALKLDEHDDDGDRLIAARLLARGDLARLGQVQRIEARRVLLAAAAAEGQNPASWSKLEAIGPADLAAMARELPPDAAADAWEALWTRSLRCLEDGPQPGEDELLAELFASLRRRGTGLDTICEYLDELRQLDELRRSPSTGQRAHLLPGEHGDAALQIALTWFETLTRERCDTVSWISSMFGVLHRLPPVCVPFLSMLRPAPALAPWLDWLAAVLAEANEDTTRLDATRMPEAVAEIPFLAVLGAMRELMRTPTWPAAEHLLHASASLHAGDGPWSKALRVPWNGVPGEEVPQPTWRLDRQAAWLNQVLGQRWRLPEQATLDAWPAWVRLIRRLLNATEASFRTAVLGRLTRVVASSRVRLKAGVMHRSGEQVRLRLQLTHEGPRALVQPEVAVAPVDIAGAEATGAVWTWTPARIEPGDPPHYAQYTLRVSGVQHAPRLRVRCRIDGRDEDVTDWPIAELDGVGAAPRRDSLVLIPSVLQALVKQIKALSGGIAVLVLDELMQPDAVVTALCKQIEAERIELDAALVELGPGCLYPRALTVNAILNAIAGLDPREPRTGVAWPRSRGERGCLLLHRMHDLAERLLTPEMSAVFEGLIEGLGAKARSRDGPAWLLVLPADLAARWHARLAEAGACLLHPALLDPSEVDDTLIGNLAATLGIERKQVRAQLAVGGHDLRQIGATTATREATGLAWTRAELAGLDARELLALVAVSGARSRVAIEHVHDGVIADETVRSVPRQAGREPKTLVRAGEAVLNPLRLRALRRELRIRGLADRGTMVLDARSARLLQLSGDFSRLRARLLRLGLLRSHHGITTLRPDLAHAIDRLREQHTEPLACVEALADRETLWNGIDLSALAGLSRDDLDWLKPGERTSLPLFHAVGKLWASTDVVDPALAQSLVQALTGTAPSESIEQPAAGIARARVPAEALPKHRHLVVYVLATRTRLQRPPEQGDALVVIVGPDAALSDAGSGVPRIGDARIRDILRSNDPIRAFWTCVRAQVDLDLISPFVHSGTLPPGSPLFQGRTAIRAEVREWLTRRSFLILGPRRSGKTSLLNQILHEARDRDDALCVLIDAQGRDTPQALASALREALRNQGINVSKEDADADAILDALVAKVGARQGRIPVLLINEIDGLLEHSPDFLERLRGRHEAGRMRFILVGYAPVQRALNKLSSPLYHFTIAGGSRAFLLDPLTRKESESLLEWLVKPPLSLEWAGETHRARGTDLLIEASYCVPWILQEACQGLVRLVTGDGRFLLQVDDVRRVLATRRSMLEDFQEIDLAEAMGREHGPEANRARAGGRLILLLLVAERYRGRLNARTAATLAELDPAALAFTESEAQVLLLAALRALPLLDDEAEALRDWLAGVDLSTFFDALTLSMILTPFEGNTRAWCFLGHIYPSELARAAARDREPSIDDRILNEVQQFLLFSGKRA